MEDNNKLKIKELESEFDMLVKTGIIEFEDTSSLKPNNIDEAIEFFILHTTLLYNSYNFLIVEFLTENKNHQLHSLEFEEEFKIAFNKNHFYNSKVFLQFVSKYVLTENDEKTLQKCYNIISIKHNELKDKFTPLEHKFNYQTKTLVRPFNFLLLDYIFQIECNKNVAGYNIFDDKNYFTSENFYNKIILDLDKTLNAIDSLFSLKELNKSNQNNLKQTTIETPAKAIEPIRLDATQTQIVYLFQKLIEEKFINESLNPKLWNLVSQYFTDKDNKPLNNIHQTKDRLKNTKTGKPQTKSDTITSIVSDTKNVL